MHLLSSHAHLRGRGNAKVNAVLLNGGHAHPEQLTPDGRFVDVPREH
jgi:hypothetical protein